MNLSHLILTLAFVSCGDIGGKEAAKPILIGDGKEVISDQTISDLQRLSRAVAGKAVQTWMLHCDTYLSGEQKGRVFRVSAYFTPRVFTARLIRGSSILCMDSTTQNSWYKESPVVGGWSSTDKKPREYALVAPIGHPFAANGPFDEPFYILGALGDEDVVALADATRKAAPEQTILHLTPTDRSHVRAMTLQGTGLGLHIDFQKADSRWLETGRGKWMYQ